MAPLAALNIIRHPMAVQRLLTPQHKAGAQFTDPRYSYRLHSMMARNYDPTPRT